MNIEPNSIYRKPQCAQGDWAVKLLKKKGVDFHDHVLDEFQERDIKDQLDVSTTPQIFLNGKRVGGYDDLARKFGEEPMEETSYIPVIAVFALSFFLAFATSSGIRGFMGFVLCLFATLKLMDLKSFETAFVRYDTITPRFPVYAKIYPFLELIAGLGFISGFASGITGLIALFAGSIGIYSVYQAIYVQKKDLNCVSIGGGSKAPLRAVSMAENIIMAVMGARLLFS